MNVESVGEKPINKKKWIILFSVLGVLIVGLIIAIVVVLIIRNNTHEVLEINDEYSEIPSAYLDDNSEIAEAVLEDDTEDSIDDEALLNLMKEKIDTAKDEKTKAMLERDYYMMLLSMYGADENNKDKIIDGLIRVDRILNTYSSAISVADAAAMYNNLDMWEEYSKIAKNRNSEMETAYDIIMETSE